MEYGFTIDFDRNLAIQLQHGVPAISGPAAAESARFAGGGMGGMGMRGGFGGTSQMAAPQAAQPAPAASPEVQRQMEDFRSLQMERSGGK